MGEKKNVPKLRFPEFTEPWEQRKLGDMGSTFNGLSGKTKDDFGHGKAKFITYMNVFSNPIADLTMTESIEIDKKQKSVKAGDVFFTTSSETPDEVGMSSVMPEDADNIYLNSFCFGYRPTEKFDLNYLAYVLRADSFRKEMTFLAQGISRYNISKNKVMEVCIPVPTIEEQTKVGRYFRNLDNLITLHQRKLDHVKDLKKSMLQKMFPKNGQLYPEVRFPEFTDAWEQRKLGDVFTERTERANGDEELLSVTIGNGVIRQVDSDKRNIASEDKSNYKIVHKGDVPYNSMRMWQGAVGNSEYDGIVSPAYTVLVPSKEANGKFFMELFKKESTLKIFQRWSQGLTSDTWNLKYPVLSTIEISIPKIEEQKRISDYFATLDSLITLHQRELDHLKLLKKGMLQQMFV